MKTPFRSTCPIASTLDLLGDKWSLLVIRSLMLGARSYSDLLSAPERISTNILADRLKRLEAFGLIRSERAAPGGDARGRYRLTRAGAELLPVLQTLVRWGETYLPGRRSAPDWFMTANPDRFLDPAEAPAPPRTPGSERGTGG